MRTFLMIFFCGILGGLVVSLISDITPLGMLLISIVLFWGASNALNFINAFYDELKHQKKEE